MLVSESIMCRLINRWRMRAVCQGECVESSERVHGEEWESAEQVCTVPSPHCGHPPLSSKQRLCPKLLVESMMVPPGAGTNHVLLCPIISSILVLLCSL